jgi:hypothetical protein
MFLKKLFVGGVTEEQIIKDIKQLLNLVHKSCQCFKQAFQTDDLSLMVTLSDIEKEGDTLKRKITLDIAQAFLPYIRPSLCRFIELVDNILAQIDSIALQYRRTKLNKEIKEECLRISGINIKLSEMLFVFFSSVLAEDDLRTKTLVFRILKKKINEIKIDLFNNLTQKEVESFWEGVMLSNFISALCEISDILEDANYQLQVICAILR